MSRTIIETGMPRLRWSNRINAALVLGAVMMAVGFAYPSAAMSTAFVDDSVPQIVKANGP